jgi:hypothetical protein
MLIHRLRILIRSRFFWRPSWPFQFHYPQATNSVDRVILCAHKNILGIYSFKIMAARRKTPSFCKIWNWLSCAVILSTQTAISDSERQVATSGFQQWPWLRPAGKRHILSGITPPRGQWRTLQCLRIKARGATSYPSMIPPAATTVWRDRMFVMVFHNEKRSVNP